VETPLDVFDKKLRIIGFRRVIKKAIKKETREEAEYAVTVAATKSNQNKHYNYQMHICASEKIRYLKS